MNLKSSLANADWLSKKISEHDLERIRDSVRRSEKFTTGEIVPVIVRRSMLLDHVIPLCTLLIVLFGVILGRLEFDQWHYNWIRYIEWSIYIASLPISIWLSRFSAIQRIFTSNFDERQSVQFRAEHEFFKLKLNKTKEHTAILLMLSLTERHAIVIGDDSISKRLDASAWDEVISLIISGAKTGNIADGFIAGIERCCDLLQKHFPAPERTTNELSDHLIIKE